MGLIDLQIFQLNDETNVVIPFIPNNYNLDVVNGSANLIQRVSKKILTYKGSNMFNPDYGTNFLGLAGSYTNADEGSFKSFLNILLKDFKEDIKNEQDSLIKQGIKFEDSELLEDLYLNSLKYDYKTTNWLVSIAIINKTGEQFTLKII